MSSPIISIPGVGNVQFPASMTPDQVNQAAHRVFTDAQSKQITANPPGVVPPTPSELQGPPTNNYQAVPSEQTPEGHAAAVQQREDSEGTLGQVAMGFAKSGGQSIENTVGKLIPGTAPTQQELEPTNTAQTVGGIGESILEALAADNAFKSLGVLDRIKSIGTVSDLIGKHPLIAKALGSGLLNATTGAITQGVKTGTVEGAEQGAEAGAVIGTALPIAGAAIKKTVKAVPEIWNTVTGKAAQAELQSGIRSVLNDTAEAVEVPKPGSPTIRDSARALANNVETKSKSLFKTIDDATDGEATNLQQKIKNVDFKLRDIAGTDDDLEEKLFNQKVALSAKFDDVLELAKQNGVDATTIDSAKQSWRQASALRDLDTQIKASTVGNVKNAPEIVDPKKLVGRLQKLADTESTSGVSRLEDALGKDQADALLQKTYDSVKAVGKRDTAIKVGKAVGKYGLITGGIGYGAHKVLGAVE